MCDAPKDRLNADFEVEGSDLLPDSVAGGDPYGPNCPCRGCKNEARCSNDLMACPDFLHFVGTGERRNQDRTPAASIYSAIFLREGW